MTALAYQDGVLAADRQVDSNRLIVGFAAKLARSDAGTIAGACGALGVVSRFLEMVRSSDLDRWLAGDRREPLALAAREPADFGGLVILASGLVIYLGWTGLASVYDAPFYAEGSAEAFLMGAMAAGAGAEAAVDLACRWCADCGGGVDVLKLRGDCR